MELSQSIVLNNVERCLIHLRRQRLIINALKASLAALFVCLLVVVIYIAVWPNASQKLAHICTDFDWPYSLLLCVFGLWLVLSLLTWPLAFIYFQYSTSKQSQNGKNTALNSYNFLLHLNRQHVSLEESAHLLALPKEELSASQTMQMKRIVSPLADILKTSHQNWLPQASTKQLIHKILYVLLFGLILLTSAIMYFTKDLSNSELRPAKSFSPSIKQSVNYLDNIVVSVTPPAYTQQAQFEQKGLDIFVLEGSEVEWEIALEQGAAIDTSLNEKFELTLSGDKILPFVRNENKYSALYLAEVATVYSITQITKKESFNSNIATLTVQQDTAPKIEFIEPLLTITEIGKNAAPSIKTVVEISDDYGISDVKIVASIAKGSGEAVKFRDQIFLFDSVSTIDNAAIHTKSWNLSELNMEPGDELYFSIHASDNKTPEAQKTTSPIKIIRWLEDDDAVLSAEGIVIDFMPEYFKSQRQIIIETEALIDQSQSLAISEFKAISRALAFDQSELKQSYGQYLGDEFDSGVMHSMEAGPTVAISSEHDEDEEHDDESEDGDHENHHEQQHANENDDLSGYQQAIEQFGHNHGEADIGFIKTSEGQINPRVLMKRAIAEMWQAELHLQLSEPKQALPYEKAALNYLNRAKQAERIYVKRLGFEPPPVTEENRYTGKLNDILSYTRDSKSSLEPNQNSQFTSLIVLLNNYVTLDSNKHETRLTPEHSALINDVAQYLTDKLTTEPEWINQLAILQRIQVANSFNIKDCSDCIESLMLKLSEQVLAPIAFPVARITPYSANHASVSAYSNALLDEKASEINSQKNLKQGAKP